MNDLDKDLRYTLHELADTVPRSQDAKAGFERRLAERRGIRRPVLVAAAAALVAAFAVTIPLTVTRDDAPPAAEKKTDGLVWSPDYNWMKADAGPYVLGSFPKDGKSVDAVVWVLDGAMCVAEGHHVDVGASTDRPPAALVHPTCEDLPASWPTGPQGMDHLLTRPVLSEGTLYSGPLPGLMLFVTDPLVTDLVARAGDGSPVPVRELGETGSMRLFLADFGASSAGFGYTAYDAAGTVVENAIT